MLQARSQMCCGRRILLASKFTRLRHTYPQASCYDCSTSWSTAAAKYILWLFFSGDIHVSRRGTNIRQLFSLWYLLYSAGLTIQVVATRRIELPRVCSSHLEINQSEQEGQIGLRRWQTFTLRLYQTCDTWRKEIK